MPFEVTARNEELKRYGIYAIIGIIMLIIVIIISAWQLLVPTESVTMTERIQVNLTPLSNEKKLELGCDMWRYRGCAIDDIDFKVCRGDPIDPCTMESVCNKLFTSSIEGKTPLSICHEYCCRLMIEGEKP
jgi:hypothetical protein